MIYFLNLLRSIGNDTMMFTVDSVWKMLDTCLPFIVEFANRARCTRAYDTVDWYVNLATDHECSMSSQEAFQPNLLG